MTPALQFAESVKYTARPIIVIPTEEGFMIFAVHGVFRGMLDTVSPAELAGWMEEDFRRQQSRREEELAMEINKSGLVQQPPAPKLDLDDFKL